MLLDFSHDEKLCSDLADLLKVPKEKRAEFVQYIFELLDLIDPQDRSQKGNPPLEKAEHHLRGLLDALKDTGEEEWGLIWLAASRYCDGDLCVRTGSDFQFDGDDISTKAEYGYRAPNMISDILRPLAKGLADLTGRHPDYGPRVSDWRLHAILQDIHTWPECFGTDGTTPWKGVIGILNKLMPEIVPPDVPRETIRSIRKRAKKERKRKSPRPL